MTPSVARDTQRTGTNAAIHMNVSWASPAKVQAIGPHDLYMLAVDKSIILLEGDNDINPGRVSPKLSSHCFCMFWSPLHLSLFLLT